MSTLKDRFLKSIKDKIYSHFLKKDSSEPYVNAFKEILEEILLDQETYEKLMKSFKSNLETMNVPDTKQKEEIVSSIMYMTVYSYCESIINDKKISNRKILVLGSPGSGKSSFICSLIKTNSLKSVYLNCHNSESYLLINQNTFDVEIKHYQGYEENIKAQIIYETSSIKFAADILQNDSGIKVFLIIDSQMNINRVKSMSIEISEKKIRIEGIIISKKDFIGSVSSTISSPTIFNSNIVGFTEKEIVDANRKLCGAYDILPLISSKLFNSASGAEDVRNLLSMNIDMINLETYKVYIGFMISIDYSKFEKMSGIFDFAFKKLNIDSSVYKQAIEKFKTEQNNGSMVNMLRKHINIIDSMRSIERKQPGIIDIKRAKRIANGSGVNVKQVFELLERFEHTKKTIKFMSYSKMFGDLK